VSSSFSTKGAKAKVLKAGAIHHVKTLAAHILQACITLQVEAFKADLALHRTVLMAGRSHRSHSVRA